MVKDRDIVRLMAKILGRYGGDGQTVGSQLETKILPCKTEDLVRAVTGNDMRAALNMLMARRPGSSGYPELDCIAEKLKYLCLAEIEDMRREAVEIAGSINHPAAKQAREHLIKLDAGAARAVLCVYDGFEYDPVVRRFKSGWQPGPGYAEISDSVPEERRDDLAYLAWLASRMPAG